MPDAEPRYTFPPMERRGLVVGLEAGQLLTMGAGALLALAVHAAVGGPGGALAAVSALAAAVAGAVWSRDGHPIVWWGLLGGRWLLRHPGRARVSDAPLRGAAVGAGSAFRVPSGFHRSRSRGALALPGGVELVHCTTVPAGSVMGALRDRRARTWAAVIPVRGRSFGLLDPDQQAVRLDAWRSVLAAVARPGTPVVRLQWLQRTAPGTKAVAALDDPPGAEAQADGPLRCYRELVAATGPSMAHHDTWVVMAVAGTGSGRASSQAELLAREVRFLEGQLRRADLAPEPALSPEQLAELISGPRPGPPDRPDTWAMGAKEDWSEYRLDGRWHATYWISEWPRVDVGPDFLGPLLLGSGSRAVSVVMAPVSNDRALREARSARTADLADAQLRAKAGFLQSARRDREAEGAARREAELADGHAEYRFNGYVTVSADDREGLAAGCADLEHAGQAARLELRRLFGRQAEAYSWTLPLARGLR